MSVSHTAHRPDRGISAMLRQLGDTWRSKSKQNQTYRRVYFELSRLSDRDLSDIGMSRSDIIDVARQAALDVR